MILTEDEKQILRNGGLVHLVMDDMEYVVVRADVFRRLTMISDEGLASEEIAKLVKHTMSDDDANDPLLESYQSYRR